MKLPTSPVNASKKTMPSTSFLHEGQQLTSIKKHSRHSDRNTGFDQKEKQQAESAQTEAFSQLVQITGLPPQTCNERQVSAIETDNRPEACTTLSNIEHQSIRQIRQWADRIWLNGQRDNLLVSTSIGSAPVTIQSSIQQGKINIAIYCADEAFTKKMQQEKWLLDRKPGLRHIHTSISYQASHQTESVYSENPEMVDFDPMSEEMTV